MDSQEYTGWFKRSTLDKLRDHIRARFMGLMPDELVRELQGLPRQSWAPSSKKVTWKDDESVVNNDVAPPPSHPLVDETGTRLVLLLLNVNLIILEDIQVRKTYICTSPSCSSFVYLLSVTPATPIRHYDRFRVIIFHYQQFYYHL